MSTSPLRMAAASSSPVRYSSSLPGLSSTRYMAHARSVFGPCGALGGFGQPFGMGGGVLDSGGQGASSVLHGSGPPPAPAGQPSSSGVTAWISTPYRPEAEPVWQLLSPGPRPHPSLPAETRFS